MSIIEQIPYESVVEAPYCDGAVIRDDFPGFREDYLALHSLLRRYPLRSVAEIGTSYGRGTNIICNAIGVPVSGRRRWLPGNWRLFCTRRVVSIDVPAGTDSSIIYPGQNPEDGHPNVAGVDCAFSYTQLFGDSTKFDFEPYYPLDGWFIDGKHSYEFVVADTAQALKASPVLIVWHDLQITEVAAAVVDRMANEPYRLHRIEGTRIGYAERFVLPVKND